MTAARPITWQVLRVVRVVDGDTIRVIRTRRVDLDGGRYLLTDAGDEGVPIRLTWVDTPERGHPAYHDARNDLAAWIDRHPLLKVVCYESAGWDRLLGDLIDPNTGESASQWLMAHGNNGAGWPPYVPT